jgi:demethylmenaquinone methyltransferase/2-methoxy-6-polyprenyl-1,4-benzoquinol methylase
MTDNPDDYLQSLLVTVPLREPALRSAIRAVPPANGSRGVDVGCGIGTFTQLLADSVGGDGHVTGIDVSQPFLKYASNLARESNLAERLSFRQGNANHIPFDDCSLDWAWSVDCVGYGTSNSAALIEEMARVVRPGGVVAILAWSSERLLPGHPRLEARLSGTTAGLAPFKTSMSEDTHLSRGLGWFRKAGLQTPSAIAIAGSCHAPLTEVDRAALAALIEMRWPGAERELEHADRLEFERLCDPKSPDYILQLPDYYGFFTYTLFWGTVAN